MTGQATATRRAPSAISLGSSRQTLHIVPFAPAGAKPCEGGFGWPVTMTTQHHLRLAGSAIAAALVLGTTPAFAQDAAAPGAPPITIVVPEPSAAPAPVAVIPSAQIEAPVVSSTQDDLRAAAAIPQASTAERSVQRNRAAVAPRAATAAASAPIAAAGLTASQSVVDAAPAAVLPAAVEAAPIAGVELVASETSVGDEILLGVGLLAALGLGGLALAMTRRRRAGRAAVYTDAPVVADTPDAVRPAPAPIARRSPTPQWTSPAAFALPAVVPEDIQARNALIERMVAAKPDAANPFKARKSRTRRARQILSDRLASQRPVLEDRVVARPAAPVETNPQREFEQA